MEYLLPCCRRATEIAGYVAKPLRLWNFKVNNAWNQAFGSICFHARCTDPFLQMVVWGVDKSRHMISPNRIVSENESHCYALELNFFALRNLMVDLHGHSKMRDVV